MTATTTAAPAKPRKRRSTAKPPVMQVTGAELARALKRCKPLAQPSSVSSEHQAVRLVREGRVVSMQATRGDHAVRVPITASTGPKGFDVVVNTAALANAVGLLGTGDVALADDDRYLTLRAGKRQVQLQTVAQRHSFGTLRWARGDTLATFDAPAIAGALKPALAMASRDETRPVLCTVALDIAGRLVIGTDSYRLGVFPAKMAARRKQVVMVPQDALSKALTGTEQVTIGATDRDVTIDTGDALYVARMVGGQYPNWRQLMPDTPPVQARVPRGELLAEAKFVGASALRNTPLRISVGQEQLGLHARTPDGPAADSTVPATVAGPGDGMEFGVNAEFFLDAVRQLQPQRGDKLTIALTTPLRPLLLTGSNGRALLMPIRLPV